METKAEQSKASQTATPTILIVMDGGLIREITASTGVEVMVIDYDIEGTSNEITKVGQGGEPGEPEQTADAVVEITQPEIHPEYVLQRVERFRASDGEHC